VSVQRLELILLFFFRPREKKEKTGEEKSSKRSSSINALLFESERRKRKRKMFAFIEGESNCHRAMRFLYTYYQRTRRGIERRRKEKRRKKNEPAKWECVADAFHFRAPTYLSSPPKPLL